MQIQGQTANKNGKWLEQQVEDIIVSYDVEKINYRQIGTKFGKKILSINPKAFLIKNVPYTNMYGGISRGEFVLQLKNKGPVRIECRSQRVSGSVDEKIPYLIGNCYAFEEKDVILVIDGDGMRTKAKEFAINAAKSIAHKNIRVMTLGQFKAWANKMLSNDLNKGVTYE